MFVDYDDVKKYLVVEVMLMNMLFVNLLIGYSVKVWIEFIIVLICWIVWDGELC